LSFNGNQYPSDEGFDLTTKGQIHTHDASSNAALNVGSNTYLLTADSTESTGMKWAASGAAAPTTTKGDISGFSTTQARIPVGTNNYSILADSAQALGLKWAASSTSTLTTTGDLLAASAANVLTRIGAGASGEVLTGNGAGVLPTFQAAGGGGSVEFISTQTITGSAADFSQVTFSTAVDFTAYSEMYCSFAIGTVASRDITFRFGDTDAGAVNTGSYYTYVTSDNTDGTLANEVHAGENQGRVANHPRIDAQQGVSGLIRIYLTTAGDDDTHLQWNSFVNGWDSWFIGGGQYTQIQDDLKYFQLYGGGNDIQVGGNITYYKVKRS